MDFNSGAFPANKRIINWKSSSSNRIEFLIVNCYKIRIKKEIKKLLNNIKDLTLVLLKKEKWRNRKTIRESKNLGKYIVIEADNTKDVRNDEIELLRIGEVADARVGDVGRLVSRNDIVPWSHLLSPSDLCRKDEALSVSVSQLYWGFLRKGCDLRSFSFSPFWLVLAWGASVLLLLYVTLVLELKGLWRTRVKGI